MSDKPVVLIADDDRFLLDVVRRVLERGGYSVITAKNGTDAVGAFERDHVRIAAVVLDLNMPDMDGVDTYLKLREIDAGVHVILASGYGEIDTMGRVGRQLDTIAKPYSPSALIEKLSKITDPID